MIEIEANHVMHAEGGRSRLVGACHLFARFW